MPERSPVRGEATAFSDYSSVVGARGVYALLTLAASVFTTRLLAPSEFGALSLFYVVALLIFTVSSAWTSAAVSRFGREELELSGTMARITAARAVFVLPTFVVATPVVLILHATGILPAEFTTPLALLSVAYAAVWVCFDHVVYLLETWGRQKLSAVALVVQQVVYVGVLAFLYAAHVKVEPTSVALIALAGMSALTITVAVIVRHVGFSRELPRRTVVRRVWVFSSPLIAFVVSQYVMRSVDLFMLGTFSTAAAVGTYAIAYQGYGMLQTIGTTAGPVFTPLFVSLRLAERESALRLYVERVVPMLTFIASSVLAFGMGPAFAIVPVAFGHRFAPARIPLVLLFSAAAVFFADSLLGTIVTVFDRTRATATINITAAVSNAVLDVILIGWLGAGTWAPAIATIVSVSVVLIGYTVVAARCLSIRPRWRLTAFAPMPAATIPLFVLSGWTAVVSSCALASITSMAVFLYGSLFELGDIGIVDELDMPEFVRRLTIRLLRWPRT